MGTAGGEPRLLLNALKPMLGINGDIKTPQEVMRIVNLMKDAEKLMSRCIYLNILQATCLQSRQNIVNKESLDRFLFAGGWGILNRWLNDYIKSTNFPMLIELIEVLKCLPVTIDVLKQGNTGKIIKQMTRLDNSDIKQEAANLIKQWKGMIRGGNNDKTSKNSLGNGKNSKVALDESPGAASKRQRQDSLDETQPPPEKKSKQLDDKQSKTKTMDMKPVAVESFGFMNAMVAISSKPLKKKKKTVAGKTSLPLDEILSNRPSNGDKANCNSPQQDDKETENDIQDDGDSSLARSTTDTKEDKTEDSSNDGLQLSAKNNKKKRSITWAEDDNLTKVFYFELDEEERAMMHHSVSFTAAKHNDLIREREALENARRHTEDRMVEKMAWIRPCLVEIPPLPIEYGEKSREKYIQKEREQKVLADIFLTKASLPDNPAEPDGEQEDHGHAEPKLIPHDEEGTFYPKPSIPSSQVGSVPATNTPKSTNTDPSQNSNVQNSGLINNSLLGDAPDAIVSKAQGKEVSPAVHNIMKHLMVGKPSQPGLSQDFLHPGADFMNHGSRPMLPEMPVQGGFPPGLRLPLRGSPTGGPRPLLGMQFQGRPRGNFRGRPMGPRGGQMHHRFQRPPRGHLQGNEEPFTGGNEEHGGRGIGFPHHPRGHVRGRGRGGLPQRGRGTREAPVCRHYLTPNGCRNGQNCQFAHPWVNGPPR